MPSIRDPKLDLAKAVLITFVVLGHYIEAADGRWQTDLGFVMRAIYMVHMPAFVFLAGVTAKASGTLAKIVQWLSLLVVFWALYAGLDLLTPGVDRLQDWTRPYWILWFLLALAMWQALMPLIERFPRTSVVASVAIGAFSGMLDGIGYEFSLSRAAVFLPCFVIGAVYGKEMLRAVDRMRGMARAGLVTVAAAAALYLGSAEINRYWLYGSRSLEDLNTGDLKGVSYRIILMLFALLGMASLWAILPRREGWFTLPGRRSLSVYLLHGIPVTLLTGALRALGDLPGGTPMVFGASLVLTAGTVALFSRPEFDRAVRGIGTALSRHVPRKPQGRRSAASASA